MVCLEALEGVPVIVLVFARLQLTAVCTVVILTILLFIRESYVSVRSVLPPLFDQSVQLPGYSPTLVHPAAFANPAAALLRTPALQ